ncbi:MAG TPA: nucleotidyltransferase domain-containing protein [Gaiellaceae bacterium]|nr:nucleotidyltransferase domain-containing protein [Gaiellaceae bacterium]
MPLSEVEQRTLDAYVATLQGTLGERLLAVRIFGSVARDEAWPQGMPIRSDLDLLVLVSESLVGTEAQALIDATLPLFLESGRQISPQFRTPDQHAASASREAIDADAIEVWACR